MSTPFMSIGDGHHRKVSFDTREELGDKIGNLAVMIGNWQQEMVEQIDNSKPKFIRVEVEVKIEITIRETIKTGTDQITDQAAETEDNSDKTEVGLDMSKIIEEVMLEET